VPASPTCQREKEGELPRQYAITRDVPNCDEDLEGQHPSEIALAASPIIEEAAQSRHLNALFNPYVGAFPGPHFIGICPGTAKSD